jgi:hypothetical protein
LGLADEGFLMSETTLDWRRPSSDWRFVGMAIAFLMCNFWLLANNQPRTMVALFMLAQLAVLMKMNLSLGLSAAFAFLFLVGDIRRFTGAFLGYPKFDLLLLVTPVLALVIALPSLLRLRLNDPITKGVFALMVVMILEIVNPRQGGISVGLTGAMFYLVPMLWFWIGNRYGTEDLIGKVLYQVVLPLSVLAALLGFYQTYVGFLPWEQAWLDSGNGYAALHVGDNIRPFGFSVSFAEYATLLQLGAGIAIAGWFSGRKILAIWLPLILPALFLASMRQAVVKLVVAIAVMWGFRRARKSGFLVRFLISLSVIVGLMQVGLSRFTADPTNDNSKTQALVQHQAAGLSDPLNQKRSTLRLHAGYVTTGLIQGFTHPLGAGLGSTTSAGQKLGSGPGDAAGDDDNVTNTELDFTDMFVALGVVGGFCYLFVVIAVTRAMFRYAQTTQKKVALAVVALLVCTGGTWLISGQYSISAVDWFVIGAVARATRKVATGRRVARTSSLPQGAAV